MWLYIQLLTGGAVEYGVKEELKTLLNPQHLQVLNNM